MHAHTQQQNNVILISYLQKQFYVACKIRNWMYTVVASYSSVNYKATEVAYIPVGTANSYSYRSLMRVNYSLLNIDQSDNNYLSFKTI